MATIAESYSARRATAKAPISTHPAFPAIVALWFAALLGLGTMVLPGALLDRFVTVTGLSAVLPAAAPPLGFTGRALIGVAGALLGAGIGLMLARQVAKPHAFEAQTRGFAAGDGSQRRPISVHEELGGEGLGSMPPSPLAKKRRSLAIAEETGLSRYLQTVPLPGQEPEHTDLPGDPEVAEAQPALEPAEALELGDYVENPPEATDEIDDDFDDESPEIETAAGLEALRRRIHTPAEPDAIQEQPMTDRQIFQPGADFDEDEKDRQKFRPLADSETDFGADAENGEPIDALPFAPPSLRRAQARVEDAEAARAEEAQEEEAFAPQPVTHLSVVEPIFAPEPADDGRALEELGLVQLAARLGASLEKRRAMREAAPGPSAAFAPVQTTPATPEDFEAAEPEEAARAIADFFGPAGSAASKAEAADGFDPEPDPEPAAVPRSLRGLALEADEDVDDAALEASFSLPLRRERVSPVAQPRPVDEDEAEEDSDDDAEAEYSSLLAMKNPFTRQEEFVRVEEPEQEDGAIEPAVVFPAAAEEARPFDPPRKGAEPVARSAPTGAPRDPADAERNLREALATLQRMSGAA